MSGLHDLLARATEQNPDQALIIYRDEASSYGEVNRDAGRLASYLRESGVKVGDRVALVLDNLPQYPVAYYGILKAGAAVVPLCADTRVDTLTHALAHSEAAAVIIGGKNSKLLDESEETLPHLRCIVSVGAPKIDGRKGLSIVELDDALEAAPNEIHHHSSENDLASLMYTSGTTAQPKGVMLSHLNLMANTESIVDYLKLDASERIGLVLPFFYSYGNSILHTHISAGATVVVLGSLAFPASVLQGIQNHKVTGFSGVPSTFARLIHFKSFNKYDTSSLRYVTQAGGPMTPALTEKLKRAMPQVKVFVMYGQTEAAPRLSYLPPEDLDRKMGSVGIALTGVELNVLDEDGAPVAPGEVGELVAKGDNIMCGYWKAPEETARVLRPEGLRTGDLARVDDDGFFYIVGRNSDMIKAGAHRISPKEIEAVVEMLPEVAQCAAVGVPHPMLGEAIAAFIVLGHDKSLDNKAVLRACLDKLPRFKIPTHVLFVESLPRTKTGKLRRKELKAWVEDGTVIL
jgi:long-chain acyl-CoA synthetase